MQINHEPILHPRTPQGRGSAHELFTGSGVTYKVDYDILPNHCYFLL